MNGQDKNGNPCPYKRSFKKHKYLVDSPFKISNKCCDVMKKRPMKKYQREHGLAIVIGTMAAESALRRGSWIRTGCNAFNTGRSQPLSFWTEQDILRYIKQHNLTIPSVYGNIVEVDGKLSCTGESRTGCVFCPIGVHLDKGENKFQRLARTHPKLHHYCMYKLGLKDLLDFVGVDWREKRVQQQQLFGFY